ncbi:YcdB/YcdC domain-containing protein [Paenibacillus piri]|uniref:S-layer protein n=1 Tax=Paenibacillus piri TaxID=2547395 RepID=A0A4R5KTD4_9BACL|nr:YcdB/YcdC domain-containing protein [Paenibacillus piri]TDF98285.1 S-layer protein [Paenibacillus piri]
MVIRKIGIAGIAGVMLLGSALPVSAMKPEIMDAAAVTSVQPAIDPAQAIGGEEAPVDTKINRERAIELAKQYVHVPDDYVLQGVGYQSSVIGYGYGSGRGVWSMSFNKQDQKRYYGSIHVSVDADTGKLQSFYINENNPDKKPVYPPKTDQEQAKRIALDFIAKMNPDIKNELAYYDTAQWSRKPLTGSVQYPLQYVRVVNGVPFPANALSVTVDEDGRIISYNMQWDPNLTFEKASNPINAEQAKEQFLKLAEPRLQYVIPYSVTGKTDLLVSYQMETFMVDAVSGEALLFNGEPRSSRSPNVPASDKPLAEKPKEPLKLTKEQAAEKAVKLLALPADAKLANASYQENHDPRTGQTSIQWDLSWSASGDKDGPMIHAAVDANTGAVLRYSKYDYRPAQAGAGQTDDSGKLGYDQLKEKAIAAVQKLLPMYAHELYLEQMADIPAVKMQMMPTHPFNFRRIVNGIQTDYESVSINLDRKTGDIQDYYSNLTSYPYPSEKPQVISEDKAKQALLSQFDIEQQYVLISKNGAGAIPYGIPIEKYNVMVAAGEIKPGQDAPKPETKLVYNLKPKSQFQNPVFLDAVSAEWKSRDTGEIVKEYIAPTDIEGHWAEQALKLMVDYQALDVVDGKTQPDGLITRGEMVKMLIASVNGGYSPMSAGAYAERAASFSDVAKDSKYFAYVENALDLNLIERSSDSFKPDATLSKSELADLIVRALGYRKLVQVDGLFAANATDLGDESTKGSIALVNALSIMPLEGGKFNPKEQVTRAQAATAFYKFLQVRSELQDTPMRY